VGILRKIYNSPLAPVPSSIGASGIKAVAAFPKLARRGDRNRFCYPEVLVLELDFPFALNVPKNRPILNSRFSDTIPPEGRQAQMSDTSREKLDLINRTELMEDHIRNHMPRKNKSSEEAADDLIEIVRTYLK
jgi:hypothetical protein